MILILSPKAIITVRILIYLCDIPKALYIEVFDFIINALKLYLAIGYTPTKISNDPEK